MTATRGHHHTRATATGTARGSLRTALVRAMNGLVCNRLLPMLTTVFCTDFLDQDATQPRLNPRRRMATVEYGMRLAVTDRVRALVPAVSAAT